jgi:DcuC family C4-dicarboxylate transporter
MGFAGGVALVVVAGAVVLVVRGWDVRLVLLGSALLVSAAAGDVPAAVRKFLDTFSDEKFVVPICSAMGFAYVLRHTGCDRHLVLLLVRPLRHARWLLIPGVLVVGFLVNIPVISQTSTAVCIGPVVVPLMRRAGYSLPTAGACLLLGASVGGELLNPGAPELKAVEKRTGVPTTVQARQNLPPLVFTQLAVSVAVFWVLSRRWASAGPDPDPVDAGGAPERVDVFKALVPAVPIVLLFLSAPPLAVFAVPPHWVMGNVPDPTGSLLSTRLIGLAMLVGVLVAMAVAPGKAKDCVGEFFAGAGYGFANIVSLIVAAVCFGAAVEAAGLAGVLGRLIAEAPGLMHPLSGFVPLAFAAVSGSGMASTNVLYEFFYRPAVALGHDPVDVGALVSLGSAAGRTLSPVAAVTLMCAKLTDTNPFTLAKRVAVPLLAGMAVVVALRAAGVL